MDELLDSLTPPQREAVTHVDGPLLILAGPGSGKTRVVTHRIAHLLRRGVRGREILALTFTNKAAEEMRARVDRLAPGQAVWISTFHRFCASLLRRYAPLVGLQESYSIYDSSDSLQALRRAMDEVDFDPAHFTPQQIVQAISWAKNHLIRAEEYEPRSGSPIGRIVERVYPAYQARLLASSAVDFDDLLLHIARLLRDNPEVRSELDARYRYVLVDEYQDTNLAQYAIVRGLSIDEPNLSVTGDPDQAIYAWRGANLRNILDFERDFPGAHVVRLEQNYRSTKHILRAADSLITNNTQRKRKGLFTENDEGPPVRLATYPTQESEAAGIAAKIVEEVRSGRRRLRDFAVLYRVNALSRILELALSAAGLPYQIVNGVEFFQRKEIKDVLGYLTLLVNPRDDIAFARTINTPARGIGKASLDRLTEHARKRELPLLEAAREAGLVESLSKRAAVSIARFVAMMDRLGVLASLPVEEILGHVLSETGYRDQLAVSEQEEDQQRLANIEELLTAAREFDGPCPSEGRLEEFLERASLVNDTDDWEAEQDRVTLMTLHSSKGLEFPVVFVVAMEEGLIPHERSQQNPEQLEEERRLLFVGMTRAEQSLEFSMARYRDFRGRTRMSVPSPFLLELPLDELDLTEPIFAPPSETDAWPMLDAQEHGDDDLTWPTGEEPAAASPPNRTTARPAAVMAPLTTAAELLTGRPSGSSNVAPEVFCQGMIVRHPSYGLGKIVALSGSGARRTATVAFASEAREKKFILRESALSPVKMS